MYPAKGLLHLCCFLFPIKKLRKVKFVLGQTQSSFIGAASFTEVGRVDAAGISQAHCLCFMFYKTLQDLAQLHELPSLTVLIMCHMCDLSPFEIGQLAFSAVL